mmetsp:Transcript_31952/g.52747  ORF Transcript_31952/g.52747 Transcript_31952/m.52747 type:complete len:138 (+) Transcript_31952:151-564(+)|eukprot:CAMPEP_0119019188 /NCGR_PEP_ID=MMETSP1176-20130426/21172_1 /TAXON_ID=265551 /ORGANISM="Synedropsis recta cf, Strain CCMP1620" /LENGTH=137 /DNA_ID=CAMNT_0006973335 /DNA_START=87 /DNA_END=500 /DNA_ORIENTATION=-
MGLLLLKALRVIVVAISTSSLAHAFHSPAPAATRALLAAPLFAVPRSRETARESAVIAEWEPLSELERRIEDGVHYDHWPETRTRNNNKQQSNAESETQACRAVFCGYRTTSHDYDRLRSADPDEATPLDDFVYNFF